MKSFIPLILLLLASTVAAERPLNQHGRGLSLQLNKQVISSGGGHMTALDYSVQGTLGQVVVPQPHSANNYVVKGGFWANSAVTNDVIFADDFE